MQKLVLELQSDMVRALWLHGHRPWRWGAIHLGGPTIYHRGTVLDREGVKVRYQRLFEALQIRKMSAELVVPSLLTVGDLVEAPRGLPRSKATPALRSLAIKKLGGMDSLTIRSIIIRKKPTVTAFAIGILQDSLATHLEILAELGITVSTVTLHTWALARLRAVHQGLVIYADESGIDHTLLIKNGHPAQVYARESPRGAPADRMGAIVQDAQTLGREVNSVPVVAWAGPGIHPDDAAYLTQCAVNAVALQWPKSAQKKQARDQWPDTRYLAAWAAAQRPSRQIPPLNLHPFAVAPAVARAPRRILLSLAAVAMIIGGNEFYYTHDFHPHVSHLQTMQAVAKQSAPSTEGQQLSQQYLALTKEIVTEQTQLATLTSNSIPWTPILQRLTQAAQHTVQLTAVSANPQSGLILLTLQGTAANIGALNGFMAQLTPPLSAAHLSQVTAQNGTLTFSLTVQYALSST